MKSVLNTSSNSLDTDKPTILQRRLVGNTAVRTKEGLLVRPLGSKQPNIDPLKTEVREEVGKRDFLGRILSDTKHNTFIPQPSTLMQQMAIVSTKPVEESFDERRDFLGRPIPDTEYEHFPTFFPQVPSVSEFSFEEGRHSILDWHRAQVQINETTGPEKVEKEVNADKEKSPEKKILPIDITTPKKTEKLNTDDKTKEIKHSENTNATNGMDNHESESKQISLEKSSPVKVSPVKSPEKVIKPATPVKSPKKVIKPATPVKSPKKVTKANSPERAKKHDLKSPEHIKKSGRFAAKEPRTFIINPTPKSADSERTNDESEKPKTDGSPASGKISDITSFHKPNSPVHTFDSGLPSQHKKTASDEVTSRGMFESFFEAAKQTLLSPFLTDSPKEKLQQKYDYERKYPSNDTHKPRQDSNFQSEKSDPLFPKPDGKYNDKQEKSSSPNRKSSRRSEEESMSPQNTEEFKSAPKRESIFKTSKKDVLKLRADMAKHMSANRMVSDQRFKGKHTGSLSPERVLSHPDDGDHTGNALVSQTGVGKSKK